MHCAAGKEKEDPLESMLHASMITIDLRLPVELDHVAAAGNQP